MWREVERGNTLYRPDDVKVLRELRTDDVVERGDRNSGVTVTILDDDRADVLVIQRQLIVYAGEEEAPEHVLGNRMGPKNPIVPSALKRTVERQNIHIYGTSVRKSTVIEWYPGGK